MRTWLATALALDPLGVAVPDVRRRLILVLVLVLGGLLLTAVVSAGVYGLVRGPGAVSYGTHPPTTGASTPGAPGSTAVGDQPAVLPKTDRATVYAKALARALFDWDITSGLSPSDYTAPVLADADPSGEETSGLISDVASYEPTTEQWQQLAGLNVAQHLDITSAVVPSVWPQAVAQARGQLRPGTTAITITGTRRRSGIWYGHHAVTSEPVSFTAFLACTPAFSRCHTLRLSELNDPLK